MVLRVGRSVGKRSPAALTADAPLSARSLNRSLNRAYDAAADAASGLILPTWFKEHPSKARFHFDIKPGAETIHGDEEQLYRLFVKLAGNALKYTPAGGTVTLAAELKGHDIELSVADQGPGVSKEDQERLFEKFFRAKDQITRNTPGTGLGLAICKGIVEAHAGAIRIESEPGHGARFIARLPKAGPKA